EMPFMVAVMVEDPTARQFPSSGLVTGEPMVTTAGVPLTHAALAVTFWVVPSEKCPVAVKAIGEPTNCVAGFGVMVIEVRLGGLETQVSTVLPETAPTCAVIVDVPAERHVATLGLAAEPSVATPSVPE